jgi:hypothetical protein
MRSCCCALSSLVARIPVSKTIGGHYIKSTSAASLASILSLMLADLVCDGYMNG